MDLLPALCLCLLICSGAAFSHQSGSEVIRKVVKEDEDVRLACALEGTNIQDDVFDWKKDESGRREVFFYNRGSHYLNGHPGQDDHFKDRVFHFEEQLAVGNASIVIRKTQVADSGNYTCDFPIREPRRRAQYELIVEYILKPRNLPGPASKPSVTNLKQTKDWALLQCEVVGASPKPVVLFKDDSGNIIESEEAEVTERGRSYDIVLKTTVTKTDYYHCVVTQEDIGHQVSAKTYVFFGDSTGLIVGFVVVILVLVVVVLGFVFRFVLLKQRRINLSRYKGSSLPSDSLTIQPSDV